LHGRNFGGNEAMKYGGPNVAVKVTFGGPDLKRFPTEDCAALSHELIQCISTPGRGAYHVFEVTVVEIVSKDLIAECNGKKDSKAQEWKALVAEVEKNN
jgi:hypothetical protein